MSAVAPLLDRLSLERLFTHPKGFDVPTATNVQRAFCRVADGRPLGDLESDPVVVRSLGGAAAAQAINGAVSRPDELYLVAAIRCGKSQLVAALALHRAMTTPVPPQVKEGEPLRVSVLSLDKDKAEAVMYHLAVCLNRLGSLFGNRVVKPKLPVPDKCHEIVVRRLDGRLVEIRVAAGKRSGASLVSRWTICVIFDEAARMQGQEDGVVNFDDSRKAVIERVRVIGGQLVAVTSPWASRGPIYDAVQEAWGRPTRELVVMRATGPEMCPITWTPEACERARNALDGSYENDVLGEFVDSEAGWVSATEVNVATRASPVVRTYEKGVEYTAAIDPATSGNAWTLVIIGKHPHEEEAEIRYHVALAAQWQGTPLEPLKAREVFGGDPLDPGKPCIRDLLRHYKIREVYTDRWGGTLLPEIGEYAGVTVTRSKFTPEEAAHAFTDTKTLLVAGMLELAPVPALKADLLSVRRHRLPGGRVKYEPPKTSDGRHGDYAPATVLAMAKAMGEVNWVAAMNRARENGALATALAR